MDNYRNQVRDTGREPHVNFTAIQILLVLQRFLFDLAGWRVARMLTTAGHNT